jgi:hypothetical protein
VANADAVTLCRLDLHLTATRVANACRREFAAGWLGGASYRRHLILSKQLTTTELAQRIYSATQSWQVGNVRRAAPKFAVECGRRRAPGMPIVWRLKGPTLSE